MPERLNIVNFRAIQGYRNRFGEVLLPGRIFRGAALDRVSEDDIAYMEDTLRIRFLLDFRDENEARQKPDAVFPKAQYLRTGAMKGQAAQGFDFAGLLAGNVSMKQIRALKTYLRGGYGEMPFDNPAYRTFFELLLENRGAVYFHCSAGKDRTGICAMLFMLALGMSERDIIQEYMLSNACLKEVNRQFYRQHNVPVYFRWFLAPLLKVSRKSIRFSLREIKRRYPSYDAFLESEYGIDEAKRKLLRSYYCQT